MLSFSEVKYRYHSELFEFDLKVNKGNVVAILGPSGAGKSTLLSLLAGFISPESGDITINNLSLLSQAPHQRPLSMLFQEHNLFAHLSVFDNIGLGIKPNLRLYETEKRSVTQAAQQVGVDELLHRLPEQLSGGQKQRLSIARALLEPADLIIMDNVLSAVDYETERKILEGLFKRLEDQSVLVVSHRVNALEYMDEIIVLNQGKVIAKGDHTTLLKTCPYYYETWQLQQNEAEAAAC